MEGTTELTKIIKIAKSTVQTLFSVQGPLRLEEVELDDRTHPDHWNITVSFSEIPGLDFFGTSNANRTFKVVRIRDHDAKVRSVTNRTVPRED